MLCDSLLDIRSLTNVQSEESRVVSESGSNDIDVYCDTIVSRDWIGFDGAFTDRSVNAEK